MKNKTILMLLAGILMLPAHVFAEPDYLVDSDWLSEHIDDENIELKPADPSMFMEFPEVYDHVAMGKMSDIILIDARPTERYVGGSHHGVAQGHIPGAINIISMDGTDGESQTWRSDEDLSALYEGIPKDKTLYVYCDDGFRMSLAYQQLTHLGYQNVRLYNGGWSQWGNWLDLPTVTGNQPFSGDFDL